MATQYHPNEEYGAGIERADDRTTLSATVACGILAYEVFEAFEDLGDAARLSFMDALRSGDAAAAGEVMLRAFASLVERDTDDLIARQQAEAEMGDEVLA